MSCKVSPAASHPCSACPWLISNHGKPHPHGWYTKKNRSRLWSKLRHGDSMSCHPTDPRNEVPDGHPKPPDNAQTLECAGALILQQRELMRFQKIAHDVDSGTIKSKAFTIYRQLNFGGMTLGGLTRLVERLVFGGFGSVKMSRPNLRANVGHDALRPWDSSDEQENEK